MNYKMLLPIALLTITSALVFAGESNEPGNPLGKSPNFLNLPAQVKLPKNPAGGSPIKPSERLNNNQTTIKAKK